MERGKQFLARTVFRWIPARIGDNRIYMNPANTMSLFSYLFDVYEWREVQLIRRLVKAGDTALDIGANIGYYSLKLSQVVEPRGTVHAFEPDPTNLEILRRNIGLNSLSNVKVHGFALANFEGPAWLYRSKQNTGDYALSPRSGPAEVPVQVICRRLDSLSEEISEPPSILKIDVQGFEPAVLEGAQRSLNEWQPRPSLLVEFEPASLTGAGFSPQVFLDSLTKLDYRVGKVSQNLVTPIRPEEHSGYRAWAGDSSNLIAIPEESRDRFRSLAGPL